MGPLADDGKSFDFSFGTAVNGGLAVHHVFLAALAVKFSTGHSGVFIDPYTVDLRLEAVPSDPPRLGPLFTMSLSGEFAVVPEPRGAPVLLGVVALAICTLRKRAFSW